MSVKKFFDLPNKLLPTSHDSHNPTLALGHFIILLHCHDQSEYSLGNTMYKVQATMDEWKTLIVTVDSI